MKTIWYVVDESFIPFIAVNLCSLKKGSIDPSVYSILIYTYKVKKRSNHILQNFCDKLDLDITIIDFEREISKNLEACNYWNICKKYQPFSSNPLHLSAFIRIILPLLNNNHSDFCLYLDADTVIQSDITNLWDICNTTSILHAVQDKYIIDCGTGLGNYQDLNINPNDEFFNSGFLFINTKLWNKSNITHQLCKCLQLNCYNIYDTFGINCGDQYLLNAVFASKWSKLDEMWNRNAGDYNIDTKIVHYIGTTKPWESYCHDINFSQFYNYLKLTPWSKWRNYDLRTQRRLRRNNKIRNLISNMRIKLGKFKNRILKYLYLK